VSYEPPIRISTLYGIQLDPETSRLLVEHYDVAGHFWARAAMRVEFRKNTLVYHLTWDGDDNEYKHKAIRKYLRECIKCAKAKAARAAVLTD